MWWFKRKKRVEKRFESIWKEDYSDCITADYLPNYSVCQNENNQSCRYVAHYSGMELCSHPLHKSFIPEDAEPFNPRVRQVSK